MNRYQVRPKKSLGQNFLHDDNIARKIIASLSVNSEDVIIEVGPGTGTLTKHLLDFDCTVIAIEIDKKMVDQLQQRFRNTERLKIIHDDFLKISFTSIPGGQSKWKVIGNLPYHITSQVLFRIFEHTALFSSAVFMVQKEVAQRIVAQPNSKEYGILSVFSQFYADVKKLFTVSKHVFFPEPDVMSAVVRWDFKSHFKLDPNEVIIFKSVVKGVFSQRRKMLRNSLKTISGIGFDMSRLNFDLKLRPEQLSVKQFVELSKQIAANQVGTN